ncbi:MAG: thioredoxin family protein [Flavobacteriaceae bacterium]|nr:MAG: thioredoxin family protein [Flavobacteriaceae bacterium]
MLKLIYTLIVLVVVSVTVIGCTSETKKSTKEKDKTALLYHPEDDAQAKINEAVSKAKLDGKHVLLQVGGNWCGWCILFDKKVKSTEVLKVIIAKNFIVYHLNYSKENKNKEVLDKLGNPEKHGFPVFVVLDGAGKIIHTQPSGVLEEGKGHSTEKVLAFLNEWSPMSKVK